MLTVILAGGKGSRILEETRFRPKALVNVGGQPIIECVMDCYAFQGFQEFLILTGYKGGAIIEHFESHPYLLSQEKTENIISFQFKDRLIHTLDTGEDTTSAKRLRLAAPYIREERFMLTYCDGLCSVSMTDLLKKHITYGGLVTLTAVRPQPRFGVLKLNWNGRVTSFIEKNREESPFINGGFFVMEHSFLDCITENMEHLERDVLSTLATQGKLWAYEYDGFWQCMDTLSEKEYLSSLCLHGIPPWIAERRSI